MTDPRNRPFIPGYSTTYASPEGVIDAQNDAHVRGMVSFDVQYLAKTAFEQSLIGGYAGIPGNHVLAPGSLIDVLAGSAGYLASGSNPALNSDQLAGMADPNFLNYLEWRDGSGWAVKPGMEATFNEHMAAVKNQLQGFAYSGTLSVGTDGAVHYAYVRDTGVVYNPATQSWGPGFFDYETWTAHPLSELSPDAQIIAQNNYYQTIRSQIRGMEANGTVPSSAEFITEAHDGRLGSPRFERFRYGHDGDQVESDFDDVFQYNVFQPGFADEAVDYNTDFLDPSKFAFNVHNFATAVPERLSIGYLNEHPAVLNQVTDLYLTQDVLDRYKANALAAWGESDVRYQSLATRDLASVRSFIHEHIANGGVDLNNPVYAGFAGLINEICPHVELLDAGALQTFKDFITANPSMIDRFLASPIAQGYTRDQLEQAYMTAAVPVSAELAGIFGDFVDFSKHAQTA
ncbi:hypothetical protein GC177_01220, partial [bacterium]|nr:hypothetical protein [bacterium]